MKSGPRRGFAVRRVRASCRAVNRADRRRGVPVHVRGGPLPRIIAAAGRPDLQLSLRSIGEALFMAAKAALPDSKRRRRATPD